MNREEYKWLYNSQIKYVHELNKYPEVTCRRPHCYKEWIFNIKLMLTKKYQYMA